MKKKSKKLIQNDIYVKRSDTIKGYGVYANCPIKKGTIIEQCYFILGKGGDNSLEDFYFDVKKKYGLVFGYGSIYNHSEEPNADYTFNLTRRVATFKATRLIRKDEEIFISYGDKWFKDRKMKVK